MTDRGMSPDGAVTSFAAQLKCAAQLGLVVLMLLAMRGVADEGLEALEERAFREAAALAGPSLVRIETVGGLDVVGRMLASSGPTTGVVVGEDGWIITSSFNFATNPASILVTTTDGRRHPAQVIASDRARMLTLLKIDAAGLTPLEPVPQAELAVGQWAIALGQTFDQPFPNVSVGIISALGRIWGRAVQTDAKVSPANYGGPLVDIQGRGIGILVPLSPQKTDETAGVDWYDSGIGFAIPLEDVYAVFDRLRSGDDLRPGLMGVSFADRSPIAGAAKIDRVRPGSPADEAGLVVGDTIVEIDGQPVARVPHLRHVLGRKYAGDEVSLTVERGDETVSTSLRLAAELSAYERPYLGILPQRVAVSAEDEQRIAVRFVFPDSPAAEAMIERGDRITVLNGDVVTSSNELAKLIGHQKPGDVIALNVQRDGGTVDVEVTLTAINGELPETIPSFEIPSAEDRTDSPATGRLVDTLGGDEERAWWAYVPEGYNPEYGYGLVVWLHPPGDTMEGDVLSAWRKHCERRGLILIAPKTSRPSGWSPADVDFLTDLVEEFQERYTIDPARIVMHATAGSAEIAAAVTFRERDTFRGLSLIDAPLRVPPPETDPDAPLQFHFTAGGDFAGAETIEQIVARLRELGFPVTAALEFDAGPGFDRAVAERVALWVDALDRM